MHRAAHRQPCLFPSLCWSMTSPLNPLQAPPDEMQQAAVQQQSPQQQRWQAGCAAAPACRAPHVRAAAHVRPSSEAAPQLASFDDRCWSLSSTEEEEQQAGSRQAWRFSVASYNILADRYARSYRSYLYHEVPAAYLEWQHRRATIVAELAFRRPDVACLQEVDRFAELEAELQQLGYSGIYLQRDGGRRDGCATFYRTSLLRPALVRQVRYSQHDLKDNVALLVLFEPRNAAVEQAVAAAAAKQQQHQQQQQQDAAGGQQRSSLDQQQQQQATGVQGMLRSWLPSGWFDSSGSSDAMSYTRTSSHLLLQPVHSPPCQGTGGTGDSHHHHHQGRLYYCPVEVGADTAAAAAAAAAVAHSSPQQQQQEQPGSSSSSGGAPEWVRCGVLVANTHIMFTPEKGDTKLGQARLLLHEAQAMAEWYLGQQQQQLSQAGSDGDRQQLAGATAVAGSGDPSSSSGGQTGLLASGMQGVATILTGDFNSTPSSALYRYVSRGLLDLHAVNKRNVSHMAGATSSSGSHHKGYRGFRRAAEHSGRRSTELQRQPSGGAGSSPRVGAAAAASPSSFSVLSREGSSSSGPAAAMAAAAATAGGASAPGLARSSSSAAADGGVPLGSSPLRAAALPHQQQTSHHRWSDKEVRRAAGMSYDELLADSEAHVTATQQASAAGAAAPAASSSAQIARAAAAFGLQVAAGAGAAAAATAAASAAATVSAQQQQSAVGSPPRQPLLLRHGLQLESSYRAVLGHEPEYTSSHSQFMDTCDYIFFSSRPLTQRQAAAGDSGSSSSSDSNSSSWEDEAAARQQGNAAAAGSNGSIPPAPQQQQQECEYELRPVAVLVPPDGMRLPKGLPSKSLGSDHICLLTDFELVLKQQQ